MHTDSAAQPSPINLTEQLTGILNASLNGIIAYEAVRSAEGDIVDFTAITLNRVAQQVLQLPSLAPGWRLLEQFPGVRERGFFNQYIQVVETGESLRFETSYQVNGLMNWYDVSIVPMSEGFVITFNDITSSQRLAETQTKQNELLQSILNSSLNNVFVYEAIRDVMPDGRPGLIRDFSIRLVNQQARQDTIRWLGTDPLGNTLLRTNPDSRQTGQFDLYCQVTETGRAVHTEQFYPTPQVWFTTTITKLADGCVVTGINITAQKLTALASERQTQLLNNVLNGSPNGIMSFEAIRNSSGTITDFRFITINQVSEQLVSVPTETMLHSTLLTVFPGNVETGLFDLYVHTTNTGEPTRTEVYYDQDGLDFWLDISARPLNDGFVVTFTDISLIKRATTASTRQAELLNTVLDNSQTAISLHEAIRNQTGQIIDFRTVLANTQSRAMWGPLADAIINQPFTQVASPEQRAADFPKYINVVETGEPDLSEFTIGNQQLLRLTAKSGDGVVISTIDITEIHQLQQQLEASATELQTIIDTSQTGIFLFSPVRDSDNNVVDFRFRLANRMLAAYVGQQPDAVVGALGSTWFPGYQTNGLFDAYNKTYATGETQRFDFHYDVDNIDVWLDIMATKLGDEVLVTFGDYTPLKKLQQRLEASVIDLQRSNANLEQFAYVASHDLQEPLRKIRAFGDIIQTQYAPVIGSQGTDMIQRMQSAAERMQVLIRDVLAYSRIATRRENIGLVKLNEVVHEVLENLETAISDKAAIVTIGPLPTVPGDAPQLRQLMQNLLSNALKFVRPDTLPQITMHSRLLRGCDADMAISSTDANRSFHLIELRDNGIGFEPHHAERIFQVFQRLHSRSHYEGTGIGLAIVHKVVENHQGYIEARGNPGEGATFRILLPTGK